MQQKPSIGTQFTRLGLLGYIGLLWTAVALMYGITQASTTIMLVSIPGIFAFLISFITQRSFALALYGHSTIIIWFQGALLRSESFGQSKIEDVANIIRDVILETEYAVAKSDRVPEMLAPEYQPPPQRVPVYLPEREAPAWQPPPPTARDSTANPTWYGGGMPERTTSQSPTVEDLVDAMKEFSRMAPPRPLYKKFMGHLSNHFRDRDPTFFKKILDVYNIHKVKLPATGDLRADQIVAASRVCDLIVKFDSPASNPKALGNLAETLRSLIR
jgi:hypothetical protein